MAMLVQYLSAKLGIATDHNLPELCRALSPRAVSWGLWVQAEIMAMSTDVAEFLGAAIGAQPAVRRAAARRRRDHGRDRLRDPGAPAARLPAVRAGDRRTAGHRLRGLPLRDAAHRAVGPHGARRLPPPAEQQRRRVPRGGDHRRHGDAARDLPAFGADQRARAGARRRRAPPGAALRAGRRDHRPRHRGADQHGDAGGVRQAVSHAGAVGDLTLAGRARGRSAAWSGAAPRWPSRWRCWPPARRRRAWGRTPARS